MAIIEIKKLTKTYGNIKAVRGNETQTLEAKRVKVCKPNYPASAEQVGIY
jgi:hypothetical protein